MWTIYMLPVIGRGKAFMVQIHIRENRIEMICRSLRIIRVDKKVFPWMWILNHFGESFIGMPRDTIQQIEQIKMQQLQQKQ